MFGFFKRQPKTPAASAKKVPLPMVCSPAPTWMTPYTIDEVGFHYAPRFPPEMPPSVDAAFPSDLPPSAAATHIGMFLAWVVLRPAGSGRFWATRPEETDHLLDREITPGRYVMEAWNGSLHSTDLGDEYRLFAHAYYSYRDNRPNFMTDWFEAAGQPGQNFYAITDTWANYYKVAPVITRRFEDWKTHGLNRS